MIAARTGNLHVVQALLDHGANVNAATTETRNSALMWAVAGRHSDIARVLIRARADVHISTDKGFTPLLIAARNGDIEMAKMLIAAGVDVDEAGTDGIHALPFSIVVGQADFALFLLDQGADPNAAMAGLRALHTAVASVRPWVAEWSQKHGAAVRGKDLTRPQRLALVGALLARGADPNAADHEFRRVRAVACLSPQRRIRSVPLAERETFAALLRCGSRPTRRMAGPASYTGASTPRTLTVAPLRQVAPIRMSRSCECCWRAAPITASRLTTARPC